MAGGSSPVLAQEPSPCEPLLAAAEGRYVNREFAEAESLVRACLAQDNLGDDEALRSYRLLTLIFLRQDDLPAARQTVLSLLGVSFEYEPDRVQDPPAYVALVTTVKDQIRVQGERPLSPDSARATPRDPQTVDPKPDVQIVETDPVPTEDADPTAELPRKRSGLVKWLMIGSGVVVAGVAAVLLTAGGSSPNSPGGTPPPPPPPFPQ